MPLYKTKAQTMCDYETKNLIIMNTFHNSIAFVYCKNNTLKYMYLILLKLDKDIYDTIVRLLST